MPRSFPLAFLFKSPKPPQLNGPANDYFLRSRVKMSCLAPPINELVGIGALRILVRGRNLKFSFFSFFYLSRVFKMNE